jgi:hypothetical protein
VAAGALKESTTRLLQRELRNRSRTAQIAARSDSRALTSARVAIAASLVEPLGPDPTQKEDRMAGFIYRLEFQDGTTADPPTFQTAVPNWQPGDLLPLSAGGALRVIAIGDNDAYQPPGAAC